MLSESTGNNTDGSLNFIPVMDRTRLLEGYHRILRTIYSPAEYYQRALDCLSRVMQDQPRSELGSIFSSLASFTRVVLALGVRDHERMEFWRYLKRATISHRRQFSQAITLAAVGYHFRKLTEALSA